MATAPFAVNDSRAAQIVRRGADIYRERRSPERPETTVAPPPSHRQAEAALRRYALGFPGAVEEFPWDERVIKVRGKIFVFLGMVEGTLRVGVKLPTSAEMALTLRYVQPSGYGLGRAGWVTARPAARRAPDVALFKGWIEQSYRAVAPKKLIAALDAKARAQ